MSSGDGSIENWDIVGDGSDWSVRGSVWWRLVGVVEPFELLLLGLALVRGGYWICV